YLRAHCRRDVSLKELADVVGLSRFHFCRLFRQQVGVSAGAYQLQLRLTEAKKMMIKGRSLAEVAIATGFYDQSHFSRHFKRYVGTTPAKYTGQPD
ncbi:MAG: helix-turn-helix domain-containing protein, partial [Phormidesmis sp.]